MYFRQNRMIAVLIVVLVTQAIGQSLVDLQIDSTGSYQVIVQGRPWLKSAPYALHYGNKWYSTGDETLKLLAVTNSTGSDMFGKYKEVDLIWTADTTKWHTSFKTYFPLPIIIFTQSFVDDLTGTSTGDNDDIISGFPTFLNEPSALHYFSYFGTFADPRTGVWGPGTNYASGISGGVPLALFDSDLVTTIISPFDNFMTGIQTLSKQLGGSLACGIHGKIKSIPAGFSHSTILYVANGVNKAFTDWGKLLLKHYGKAPTTLEDDYSLRYLGYWTDNGAYYYYHTVPMKNYADSMVDVYNYIETLDLPVQYYQFDSWWYYRGKTNGLVLWEPRPDIFPDGMEVLMQKMGSKSIVLHNRWFENDTAYYTKLGFPFISEAGGYALPLSEEPYLYLMSKAKEWGLIVYEQDWLVDQFLHMEATQTDLWNARNWLSYMDSAAKKVGVTIQMCMPLPSHILQSVNMSTVTQIRASNDYQRQVYDKNQWSIGYTSILHDSLGVFPFKDCFWSNSEPQTGCVQSACQEPNALLETLVTALSTGAVGPADKIGFINKDNIMQTTRDDGLLLKPDVPARTMDLVFAVGFQSAPALYNLTHTYSRRIVKDGIKNPTATWHYILAADTQEPFSISPADIGESDSDAGYYVYDYFKQPTVLSRFAKDSPLLIPALYPQGGAVSFNYYVIIPDLEGYTLIGERNKFAVASNQRFGDIVKVTSGGITNTTVILSGKAAELVKIEMLHVPTRTIEPYTCTIGPDGSATLKCSEVTVSKHFCTC